MRQVYKYYGVVLKYKLKASKGIEIRIHGFSNAVFYASISYHFLLKLSFFKEMLLHSFVPLLLCRIFIPKFRIHGSFNPICMKLTLKLCRQAALHYSRAIARSTNCSGCSVLWVHLETRCGRARGYCPTTALRSRAGRLATREHYYRQRFVVCPTLPHCSRPCCAMSPVSVFRRARRYYTLT